MVNLLPYSLGFGFVAFVTYFAWDLWSKNKVNHCSALLYEMIGNEEVFLGVFGVKRVERKNVTCLEIKGFKHSFIDLPEASDYFQSKQYGKILHITKFGERDFRIKKRLTGDWYTEREEFVFEEIDDGNGNIIPNLKKDKDGKPLVKVVKSFYEIPLGITQKGMDAIRVSMSNEEEINKELNEQTFWDKYGQTIVMISVFLMATLLLMKVSSDNKAIMDKDVQACIDAANSVDKVSKKVDDPLWAEKVLNYVQNRNNEPPPPN